MIGFNEHNYTPVYKYRQLTTTAAAAVWTPTTSTKIVLTDFNVSNGGAAAGTFQLRFGNVAGSIIASGVLAASSNFGFGFTTPVYDGTYDRAIFMETFTSESSGGWSCSLQGFEQE